MAGKIQTGVSRKVKTIELAKELKIIRTRSDFDKFINTQRDGATSDMLEDLNSLIDFVVHSKPSNTNRTKPINDNTRKKIQVPPTVLYKDEHIKSYPFTIPPRYIRYIQTRVTVPGLKLSDNTMIHYNLYKEDKAFIDNFNSRCSDLQISTNDFLVIMDILEKASAQCHSSKPFSYELGLLVARENGISVPAYILREVHAHWVRRRNEFGLPLIRHLWPQTCASDTSPLALFRPRAKDKMLLRRSRRTQSENLVYLYHLIDGFKRVLKILSKMRQRDEKKLILAELDIVLFDQKRNELIDPTYTCPFWNCILDIKKSRSIKKKKSSSIDESLTNKIKLDFVERNIIGDHGQDLPEAESYKKMRLSRRLGRGGRIWIDRYYLSNKKVANDMDGINEIAGDVGMDIDGTGLIKTTTGTNGKVPVSMVGANNMMGVGNTAPGYGEGLGMGGNVVAMGSNNIGINGMAMTNGANAIPPVKCEPSSSPVNSSDRLGGESTLGKRSSIEAGGMADGSGAGWGLDRPEVGDYVDVHINKNLDQALNISNYNNFDIYNNDIPLDNRPSFVNPYESGHFYNTLGFSMYSIPGYIKRQLQILNLLDNISVHKSAESM